MASIYYNDSSRNINFYDSNTGVTEFVTKTDRTFYDIASSINGVLYGVEYNGNVYSIDLLTGKTTYVADIGSAINSLTSDANGNLYAAGRDGYLYKMTESGQVSKLGFVGYSEGDIVVIDNAVYMANIYNQLVKIDLSTMETSIVGKVPDGTWGLTVDENNTLLAFDLNGKVYSVDIDTGKFTYTGTDLDESGLLMGATSASAKNYPFTISENFELNADADDERNYVAPSSGWYTDNRYGEIEIGNQEYYGVDGNDGNKVIELEARSSDTANLYTFIESAVGTKVTIQFDYSPSEGHEGVDSAIEVVVDGVVIATITESDVGFKSFSYEVDGTGETMKVEFRAVESNNSSGGLLDNIEINQSFPNQAPVAEDDMASGKQDNVLMIAVSELLANDTDADGDILVEFSVQNATNGTVELIDNQVKFTPNAGYSGPASFTYTVTDGKGGFDTATVNLIIEAAAAVNQAPVATDDSATGVMNNQLVISPQDLLGNDYDPEDGANGVYGVSLGDAVNGEVYWDGTNVIFVPNDGYTGPASFTYTIADKDGLQSTATVHLTIESIPAIEGTSDDDSLTGTDGNDEILGLAGNDVIDAGEGDDIIQGGQGDDVLIGGAGADTFVWTYNDIQPFGNGAETDVIIADFSDKLDLRDLLQNEQSNDEGSIAEGLDNYLHFSTNDEGDTIISVSALGSFADNNQTGYNEDCTAKADQIIIIKGFDLTQGGTVSDVQAINTLLAGNHLITDLM